MPDSGAMDLRQVSGETENKRQPCMRVGVQYPLHPLVIRHHRLVPEHTPLPKIAAIVPQAGGQWQAKSAGQDDDGIGDGDAGEAGGLDGAASAGN